MGLDIQLATDNQDVIYADWHEDYYRLHNLSRTFCNFMGRQHVIEKGEPELDQIGKLTGVDIEPLYKLENYPVPGLEAELQFHLDRAISEADKQQLLQEIETEKARLTGNLDRVTATIEGLLGKLAEITNLPSLLTDNGLDTLGNDVYFADFWLDRENGYIDNSFGQDLRNFKRFLDYARSKGSKTVYFEYG